jgi:hypothetical protein
VIQLLKLVRGDFGTSIVREERHGPAAAKCAGAGLCRLASAGPFRGIHQPAVPGGTLTHGSLGKPGFVGVSDNGGANAIGGRNFEKRL